ncbi:hypothetical protein CBF61_10245 [Lactobacillus taiwanensis]|uniref:Uncharacterized protein n=1 Tax=Lactobacillus taiwanensis TaxID=508451 RepID=A0A256LII1_9LACO|nr:hypothetical protein CBF53_00720 [Lactobacillus taiwanensis]OYR90221.1 hypothetical protein CBF59_09170 [Lactobacillus taiwanensis]OYR93259.1 hypothetical protein CBF70_01305 [Lactobacillus taiwanensis]OYR94591.1 hypothetical protein CBF51_10485 [Lactobacillus taiwanensis]OYR97217.1 hypothetical protein CBF58_00550 [Lactobacillus taiwanensis]
MFNLSKIKDAFCFWIKKLVNSNVFPILWGILTLIIALSLAFIFSFVTNNFFILYLIVKVLDSPTNTKTFYFYPQI